MTGISLNTWCLASVSCLGSVIDMPQYTSWLMLLIPVQAAHALGKGGQRPQDSLEESEDEGDGSRNHQIPGACPSCKSFLYPCRLSFGPRHRLDIATMHAEDESDGDSAASDQPGLIVLDDEEEEAGVNGQAQDGSESEESLGSFIEEDDKADTGVQGCEPPVPPFIEGAFLLRGLHRGSS